MLIELKRRNRNLLLSVCFNNRGIFFLFFNVSFLSSLALISVTFKTVLAHSWYEDHWFKDSCRMVMIWNQGCRNVF